MNIALLVPSVSRWLVSIGSVMLTVGHASSADLSKFRRIEPQFIAALGDPAATSGNGARSWGLWNQDPGPRACKLDHYPQLKATGVAPAQWKFDASDWRLEEHQKRPHAGVTTTTTTEYSFFIAEHPPLLRVTAKCGSTLRD